MIYCIFWIVLILVICAICFLEKMNLKKIVRSILIIASVLVLIVILFFNFVITGNNLSDYKLEKVYEIKEMDSPNVYIENNKCLEKSKNEEISLPKRTEVTMSNSNKAYVEIYTIKIEKNFWTGNGKFLGVYELEIQKAIVYLPNVG